MAAACRSNDSSGRTTRRASQRGHQHRQQHGRRPDHQRRIDHLPPRDRPTLRADRARPASPTPPAKHRSPPGAGWPDSGRRPHRACGRPRNRRISAAVASDRVRQGRDRTRIASCPPRFRRPPGRRNPPPDKPLIFFNTDSVNGNDASVRVATTRDKLSSCRCLRPIGRQKSRQNARADNRHDHDEQYRQQQLRANGPAHENESRRL